jgi:hypothetical protein
MFGKRCDGHRVKDLKFLREFVPFLQKTRTESQVYFKKQISVEKVLEFLDKKNERRETKITLFQVLIAAGVRTFALHPELNRFVSGRRIYQRSSLVFSFALKKEKTEENRLTHAKIIFEPEDTLEEVSRKIQAELDLKRKMKVTGDEKEMLFFLKLPRFLTVSLMKLGSLADYFGLLPKKMIENDPLFASVFCAHLGSVGLDAAFHHLFNWGSVSLFATLGKTYLSPVAGPDGAVTVKKTADLLFTLDNRITDGIYASKAIELFIDFIENPEKLEKPLQTTGM